MNTQENNLDCEQLNEFYGNNKKKTTIKNYRRSYLKVCKLVEDQNDFNKPLKIRKIIDGMTENPNCRKTHMNNIIKCCYCIGVEKRILEQYNKIFIEYVKASNEYRIYKKPNDKELKLIQEISFKQLTEKRENLLMPECIKQSYPKLFQHLILSLYTYLPPLRPSEWCNCYTFSRASRIKKDKSKINYICLTRRELHLHLYKTEKAYGERIVKIPKDLIKIIKNWKKTTKTKVLIPKMTCSKEPMSCNSLSKNIVDTCGCSANFLRKLYISNKIDEGIDGKERKELARIMGHDCSTQLLCYSRFSKICN